MIYFLELRDNIQQLCNSNKTKILSLKFSKVKNHITHESYHIIYCIYNNKVEFRNHGCAK